MTSCGRVTALNRHNLSSLGAGLLARAAFEQTVDVFEQGAAYAVEDSVEGVTERIIIGQTMKSGTGLVQVDDIRKNNFKVSACLDDDDELESVSDSLAPAIVVEGLERTLVESEASPWCIVGTILQTVLDRMPQSLELEARFGVTDSEGNFSNGLASEAEFNAVLSFLGCMRGWDIATDWEESRDIFFAHDKNTIRTTMRFLPDGIIERSHIKKVLLDQKVVRVADIDIGMGPAPYLDRVAEGPSIKFCVAVEETIDESDLPPSTVPTFVRQKKRKMFRKGTWDIQLTRVLEGPSWMDIEAKRVEPKFEIEIECNDVDRLFQVCKDIPSAWLSWKKALRSVLVSKSV